MKYNVSDETMELENTITAIYHLLKADKVEEATKMAKDANEKINKSYE